MDGTYGCDGRGDSRASVYFETLGCAKNEVDTRDMQERLLKAGFSLASTPEACDAVVVNTCSFIRPAIEESIDAFFELACAECVKDRGVPVIVAGCMPARFGADLASELTEAAAFVPCSAEDDIASVVEGCLRGRACVPAKAHGAAGEREGEGEPPQRSFAYVKVSDGCDRFCSYCTIPYIRGRYRSFPLHEIEAEARRAVAAGAREIVLVGQDTGLWGTDFDEPSSLAALLSHLTEALPGTWVRALYTQPESVTDELIDAMASHGNIAPYLDMPLQHVVPRLLEAMNRTGSAEEFLALVERVREAIPNVALRTTLIAGFPGETEEDFEALVSFVEEAAFDYVGVFPYSREEGTAAFALPEQIDEEERLWRAERLRTVADAVSASRVAARIGKEYPVLVEGEEEDGQRFGRAIVQAPEVDGVTYVDGVDVGSIAQGTIEDTLMYDMEVSLR